MRTELERRYGDDTIVRYHNVQEPEVREAHVSVISEIENRGLMYPVTAVDGVLVYDGAVSYPAIMRAVQNRFVERQEPAKTS